MVFFQVDDQFQVNPKARALAERALGGDLQGLAALGLWTMAGSLVQAGMTDGVVERNDLVRITLNPALADDLADHLVKVSLWHGSGHDCDRCPPVTDGTYRFHDWFDMRYDRGEQIRTTRRKRNELKDPQLMNELWARDGVGTTGWCRYCTNEVKRADRKSDRAWHPDHVDPTKAVGIRNIALACRTCNQQKGNRTPAEAGMTLLPSRTRRRGDAGRGVDSPHVAGSPTSSPPPAAGDDAETSRVDSPVDAGSPAVSVSRPPRGDGLGRVEGGGVDSPRVAGSPTALSAPRADGECSPVVAGQPRVAAHSGSPPGRITDRITDPISDKSVIGSVIDHCSGGVPARVAGAHAPGQGPGGVMPGSPREGHQQGDGQGQPPPAGPSRRRRRRRSRGGSPGSSSEGELGVGEVEAGPGMDAGAPPEGVPLAAGRFGSPWLNHRGPWQDPEARCEEHGGALLPCRRCKGDG